MILPLSPLAVSLFRQALAIRRATTGPHVFETRQAAAAGRRRDEDLGHAGEARAGPADAIAHDLRRSMRTDLGELDHGGAGRTRNGCSAIGSAARWRRLTIVAVAFGRLRPLADAGARGSQAIVGATPAEVVALVPAGRP